MVNVPARYVPKGLSKKDRKIQKRELKKSRKMYKGKKYYTRKKVKSLEMVCILKVFIYMHHNQEQHDGTKH